VTLEEIAAPATIIEQTIAAVLSDALGTPVGLERNFFEMGATSLIVAEAAATLRKTFRQPLKITDLFAHPTVKALALFLASRGAADLWTITTLPGAAQDVPADASFLQALGSLWVLGAKIDWRHYHRGERRNRVPLPAYPFERRRFWIDPDPPVVIAGASAVQEAERTGTEGVGLFQAVWQEATLPVPYGPANSPTGPWLIFADEQGLGDRIAAILRDRGEQVTLARAGSDFVKQDGEEIKIAPASRADYDKLVAALQADGKISRRILHLWSVSDSGSIPAELEHLGSVMAASFWSILFFAQAFGPEITALGDYRLAIGSNRLQTPEGDACESPVSALLMGPCGVIPKELPDLQCQHIDFAMPKLSANGSRNRALEEIALEIIAEIDGDADDSPVAYRRGRRFVRTYEPLTRRKEPIKLRDGAVHVITGGLGGIEMTLAKAIAAESQAKLVLIARTRLPDRDEWSLRIASGGHLASTLRQLEVLERNGAQVMTITADVTDEAAMREALAAIHQRFGTVSGVIHAAGTIADSPLLSKTEISAAAVLAPKVQGTLVVDRVFGAEPLEYLILCASVSSTLAPAGQIDYAAANAFLDAYARSRSTNSSYPVIALQFPRWSDVGMAADHTPTELSPAMDVKAGSNGADKSEVVREITLSLASDWIVREHRTRDGVGVFPGTGYIEIIMRAANELMPLRPISIHDLQFKLPLEVRPGETRRLRSMLHCNGAEYQFAASMEAAAGWVECASARVMPDSGGGNSNYDLAELRRRCAERKMGFAHRQNRVQETFFDFGPRWQTLDWIAVGHTEALAHVELTREFMADLDDHYVHPALLDMATGATLFLIPDYEKLRRAYVPMNYGRINIRKPLPSQCYSYLSIYPEITDDPLVVTFDADILDKDGNVLIEIREFMMRQIRDGLSFDSRRISVREKPETIGNQTAHDRKGRDSITSIEGAAVFHRVLAGAHGANIIAFPSNFAAFEQSLRARIRPRMANNVRDGVLSDEIERSLAQWWQELLGAESLTAQSNFFQLGGQSLTAVRLFAKIKKIYGVELSFATIFAAPTIARLAQLIRHGTASAVPVKTSQPPLQAPASKLQLVPGISQTQSNVLELRHGGPRSLFFVHDGEGETLLYLNLARCMPEDVGVYAIEPRRLARVPLAHVTIEKMAAFYIKEVREKQPHGPYLLAGLCAGGVIAYEMACQLVSAGEEVELLALLEAAMPNASERPRLIAEQRRNRLKQAVADATEGETAPFKRALMIAGAIAQKLMHAPMWEISQLFKQGWALARFRLLREVLTRELAWPRLIPELSVRQIYDRAQARYAPKPLSIPAIVLVRARAGEGGDTPYREIYADETFGWKSNEL
jgi:acyl transferase domain-containing protein